MRALAADTVRAIEEPIHALGLPWSVEKRTGDTPASVKLKQRERPPTALVTTPESLSLLLSYPGAAERFAALRCIVVDEWHELLSTKRGTQTELCLARLRALAPGVRTWGLSATIGNLAAAAETLIGVKDAIIDADISKDIHVRTILPETVERFPWAGHLGLALLPEVVERIASAGTTLLFTNTRSQAELWFRALVNARPDWIGRIAIHHGSIDKAIREKVESRLSRGELLCVVCTSSLDLGVDFSPVDQVIQVGSPKGVARLMQRAGRSGHRPGTPSVVVCVPTSALELVEFAAARRAISARRIEPREPLEKPLDVLVQHMVTLASGGMFHVEQSFEEVRGTRAYRNLARAEWEWCLDFVRRGGAALSAYPRFARIGGDGRIASREVERMHRLNIGTITSSPAMSVRYVGGRSIGTIEESFIARLRPGDRFVLAGRPLELVRVRDATALVRRARSMRGAVPRWDGGRSPLSTELAWAVREMLEKRGGVTRDFVAPGMDSSVAASQEVDPEMVAVAPLLEVQARWSRVPGPNELLIERVETEDGHHVFVYPFEGRLVHEGIGALAAHRMAREMPRSVSVSANDWGIEFLSPDPLPGDEASWRRLLSPAGLLDDLLSCLNATELTRRQFRDIARVAGLIAPGFPGERVSGRRLQASSDLFFDVLSEFDPGNRLLEQARREVMEQQLEVGRLRRVLSGMSGRRMIVVELDRLSPLAFPLWAEGMRTQHVSSEKWSERVRKMAVVLEKSAGGH